MTADFYRVHIGATPTFKGQLAWVVAAENSQPTLDGEGMVFRRLSFSNDRAEAEVYTPERAAAILAVLACTYPAAELEPAMFADWIARAHLEPTS